MVSELAICWRLPGILLGLRSSAGSAGCGMGFRLAQGTLQGLSRGQPRDLLVVNKVRGGGELAMNFWPDPKKNIGIFS